MNEELLNEEKKAWDSGDNPNKSWILMLGMIVLAFVLVSFVSRAPGSKAPKQAETATVTAPAEAPAENPAK